MSKTGFQIGRNTGVCRVTGRRLEVGDAYIAALLERADSDELERADFSLEGWDKARPPAAQVFGYWRSTIQSPDAKPRLLIDDESLVDLFLGTEPLEQGGLVGEREEPALLGSGGGEAAKGAGDGGRRQAAFRFVLALILIRKRLLIVEGSNGRNLLVRPKGTPKPPAGPALIEVVDPGLDDSSVAELGEMLGALLAGGGGEAGSGGDAAAARTGS